MKIKNGMRKVVSSLLMFALINTAIAESHSVPLEVQRLRARQPNQQGELKIILPHSRTVRRYSVRRRMQDTLLPGSLRANIERLAREHGWQQVVWNVPNDYQWLGKTRIAAKNLTRLLQQVLQDYPVQAVFYQGNHILVINPRTLR